MKTMLTMMIGGVLLTGLGAQEEAVPEEAVVPEEAPGVVAEAVVEHVIS